MRKLTNVMSDRRNRQAVEGLKTLAELAEMLIDKRTNSCPDNRLVGLKEKIAKELADIVNPEEQVEAPQQEQ